MASPGPWAPRPPEPPAEERYSLGLMATGITMAGVSAPALSFGSIFLVSAGNVQCDICAQGETCSCADEGSARGATILLTVGAVLLTGGIALAIVGGRKVPVEPAQASLVPVVRVGPCNGSLAWRF